LRLSFPWSISRHFAIIPARQTVRFAGMPVFASVIIQIGRAMTSEAKELYISQVPGQPFSSESDEKTHKNDNAVTGKKATSLSLDVVSVLKAEPKHLFFPREVSQILHANPASVRQILKRLSSIGKGCGPVIKIGHGMYQYSAEKNGQLSTLISCSGNIGIENLIYVTKGARYPECQAEITEKNIETESKCDKLPITKPGYPRHLSTGQEIRWERWLNGSERLSFVSHGKSFSVDLILYLHDELIRQGLKEEDWQRVSIEVNKDGRTLKLNPEYMSLQETHGVLLKAYNHGQQARFEVIQRTSVPMKDTLSLFLNLLDDDDGKTALREVRALAAEIKQVRKIARTALDVGTKERDIRIGRKK